VLDRLLRRHRPALGPGSGKIARVHGATESLDDLIEVCLLRSRDRVLDHGQKGIRSREQTARPLSVALGRTKGPETDEGLGDRPFVADLA